MCRPWAGRDHARRHRPQPYLRGHVRRFPLWHGFHLHTPGAHHWEQTVGYGFFFQHVIQQVAQALEYGGGCDLAAVREDRDDMHVFSPREWFGIGEYDGGEATSQAHVNHRLEGDGRAILLPCGDLGDVAVLAKGCSRCGLGTGNVARAWRRPAFLLSGDLIACLGGHSSL